MTEKPDGATPTLNLHVSYGHLMCTCEVCTAERGPPPPVTQQMRDTWAAMGLQLVKTPVPDTAKKYRNRPNKRRSAATSGGSCPHL